MLVALVEEEVKLPLYRSVFTVLSDTNLSPPANA